MTLQNLARQIKKCKKCRLYKSRKTAVPGRGDKKAELMFIGEAPGKEEDRQGQPFVGKSGIFLNYLLEKNNIDPEKIFITNCVKCHPPKNRKPKKDELNICFENYLSKQIRLIKPKMIILLGKTAIEKLTGNKLKLDDIHGKKFMRNNIKMLATYHPAAGMRFSEIRKKMIRDFRKIKLIVFFLLSFAFVFPAQAAIKNLDVPFTVQAPDGWYSPFDEACEEAATVMLDNYYKGNNYIPDAKQEISDIVKIENELWGYNKDTNAHQMTHIINNYFPFEADTKNNPSLQAIKNEIDNNQPVLIPVYGRGLYNPNFRGAGPIYHVIIIKGYDDSRQEFITNEPGTIHGHDWRYGYSQLMEALHDLNYGDQQKGDKIAIFTHKDIRHSGWSDADKDGYSKDEEIKYGTDLMDKNSYPSSGTKLYEGKIIRSYEDPKVYFVQNGVRRYIHSAEELLDLGFSWADLIRIPQSELDKIPNK